MTVLVEHGRKLVCSLVRRPVPFDRLFDRDLTFGLHEVLAFPERPDRDGPVRLPDRGVGAWSGRLPRFGFAFGHGLGVWRMSGLEPTPTKQDLRVLGASTREQAA